MTAWILEVLPETRKAIVGSVGRRRSPEALKQAAVMDLCARHESAQAMADQLGVCVDLQCLTRESLGLAA